MRYVSKLLITGLLFFAVGCDPSYRIRRGNNQLNNIVSFDCLKTAIERVPEVKLISDAIVDEPFACEKGMSARQLKYLSNGESILVTSCYDGNSLKSFSQSQSGLAGEWKSKRISAVSMIMFGVESSIEKRCGLKNFKDKMRTDCSSKDCEKSFPMTYNQWEPDLAYTYLVSSKEHQFQVCPDETCNIFQAPSSTTKDMIEKFILIHDCSGWGYGYPQFEKFCESNRVKIQKTMQEFAGKDCSDVKSEQLAKCVLRKMANAGKITIQSKRTDEGRTCLTTYHIDDILEKRAKPQYPVKNSCQ